MTILDAELTFSEQQDLSQNIGTYPSTNVFDSGPLAQGNAGRDLGTGDPLVAKIICTEVFAGVGATVEIQLVTNDLADITQTPKVHWTSGPLAMGAEGTKLGDIIQFHLPPNGGLDPTVQQFMGFLYIIAGATTTTGQYTTHICRSAIAQKSYATGMVIT